MTRPVDILVVGLGPAGACAAAAAARRGLSVLAVDRKSEPGRPVQCAEMVTGMIGPEVGNMRAAVDQDIDRMITTIEDDPPVINSPFPGHMIDRAGFDRNLVSSAIAAGAECRFSTALRGVGNDGSADLSDGQKIKPKLLIGADGPRSRVGRAAGIINAELVEARQITVPLLRRHDATDIFLSGAIPGGYGWLFPKTDFAHVGVGVDALRRQLLPALLADLHRRLIAGHRVGAGIVNTTGGAIPVGGLLPVHARIGPCDILLAGDAAGLANPVTGAGINSAVVSGRMAGEAAAAWCGGQTDALDDYSGEIEDLFGPSLERARRRRRELMARHEAGGKPGRAHMRRGWIAFDDYWAAQANTTSPGDQHHVLSEA